ncbi:MAG: hypothetical protein EOM54_01580 [Clostridia bacterium]|nr:hypothetical protein [Clostridia bacterium]
MMKRSITLLLLSAMILAFVMGPFAIKASAASQEVSAMALNELGLMNGVGTNADGSVNFDLFSNANRQTATTMLVRILGKETAATAGSWSVPFSDFDSWAKPYVGYAYKNGLVVGISSTSFGGTNTITAQQYITMVLRALGYNDNESKGSVDFSYANACEFAKTIGLTDGSYTNSTTSFKRGDIAIISFNALGLEMNGTTTKLYTHTTGNPASDLDDAESLSEAAIAAASSDVSKSSDGNIIIDYGSASSGIVSISSTVAGYPKLCIIVTTPKGNQYKYFYTDTTGVFQSFVLSEGDGTYKASVYKNVTGSSYTTLHSKSFSVKLSSSLSPFMRANFFVDYTSSTKAVSAAVTLCKNCDTELEKVDAVYYYILNNFTYDYDKASSVQSGYRPDLDAVWAAKKGICFDYASTMVAMLRSQGVAAKLVVGYAGTAYHAWINVYTKETGWIEAVIYFDGTDWKLMDPTFASTGKASQTIMDFINDPSNYTAKYIY